MSRSSAGRRPRSATTRIAADQAVGLAAKRALRAGQALRATDLMQAEVVQRNETVTIVYEVPGIVLTMRGKALEAGAVGDIDQRAQRAVEPHGPGDRHRPRPRHHRRHHAARRGRREPPHPSNPRAAAPSECHIMHSASSFRPLSVIARARRCSAAAPRSTGSPRIGEQPPLAAIENPTTQPGYKPVQMPMPTPQPASYSPNSLWRNGSRAFFKDQRAHQVGDILTVKVKITDKATIENETSRSRKNNEDSGVDNFFGKQKLPIMNTRGAEPHLHRRLQRARATARARSTARKSC